MLRVGEEVGRRVVMAPLHFLQNLQFGLYCRRKAYSQVSMDVALLVANAAHLTHVLRGGRTDTLFYANVTLITLSIVLEVCIGVLICLKERFDLSDGDQHRTMDVLNNLLVWLVFVSVVVHIFVSVFVEQPHPAPSLRASNRTSCSHNK